jgi:hypothetical protein
MVKLIKIRVLTIENVFHKVYATSIGGSFGFDEGLEGGLDPESYSSLSLLISILCISMILVLTLSLQLIDYFCQDLQNYHIVLHCYAFLLFYLGKCVLDQRNK